MQTRITDPVEHSCFYLNEKKWNLNSSRRSRRSGLEGSCTFKIPGPFVFSPIVFLKQVAARVTKAMHLISPRRRHLPEDLSSSAKSRPVEATVDFHRTAAVEDCIEFIHSSFSRSNSTTSYHDSMHTL
ncbi:hypothetical protein L6164_029895 [Bauhinia variegata]|uniref:Uncharacterized protein n=1 Tax=Bauhinia variegata TaxID=167791 RepID=A0ACB9LA88_BAUVA|nr:hypothetical protein L6164_029895 [Bauhinia variegata]